MVDGQWAVACIRDNLAAWNRRDWTAFESLHAPDVLYDSPHSGRIVGRTAVVLRYREITDAVPDLQATELRMVENDCVDHAATFEYVQTGTLANADAPCVDVRGVGSPFVVHTTMFVRFDDDGRLTALRTAHR
jgi:steroid delta-isomerase-like uncharacterized protein